MSVQPDVTGLAGEVDSGHAAGYVCRVSASAMHMCGVRHAYAWRW